MKIWSDTEYVYRCLADRQRTLAFKAAIEATVRPGDIVLDVGTGSGIMALFAAKRGAGKVYAVEVGKYLSKVSRQIFAQSEFAERIIPLEMEARNLSLTMVEKPNIVICEQVTTGLIGEPQGPVISSLKRVGLIDDHTVLIPASLSTSITLVHADYNFYGLCMRFPIFVDYFTRFFERPYEQVSEEKLVHSVNFSNSFDEKVVIEEMLAVSRSGTTNGLLLTSHTTLVGRSELGTCISYAQPVILPLNELRVSRGDLVEAAIEYEMGEGFDSLEYSAKV